MSAEAMRLKAKIKNYAKDNHIAAQVVLQNYMFERFLARLSQSEYRDRFVIKGGMLIAAIVGLDTRSTMDLDTTLKGLPLTETKVREAIHAVCQIALDDGVSFKMVSTNTIRKDDRYGGFCVRIDALYETIRTPLSIDISTGDVITPSAVPYEFDSIFDEDVHIQLWGYNIETALAEKAETILSRGIFNTRPRDFYDVYILSTTQNFDMTLFQKALQATAEHRNSAAAIENRAAILIGLSNSSDLQNAWEKYRQRYSYASEISYEKVIHALKTLLI